MKSVTFAGNGTFLKQKISENHIDKVYLDKSFYYETEGKLKKPSKIDGVETVIVDSQIKYDGTNEKIKRWYRIRYMLQRILEDNKDDLLITDSDIIIEREDILKPFLHGENVRTICIPLKNEATGWKVARFCNSTNLYIPRNRIDEVMLILNKYDSMTIPIDLYLAINIKEIQIYLQIIKHMKHNEILRF